MSSSGRADFGCRSWRLHAGKFAVMHLQAHACGQVIFSNEATGEPLGAMVLAVNDYELPSGTWWKWYKHQGYSLTTSWEVWDLPPTLNSGRMCADPETVAVLPLGGASAFWHHRPYAIMALHRKKVYTSGHTCRLISFLRALYLAPFKHMWQQYSHRCMQGQTQAGTQHAYFKTNAASASMTTFR